MLAVDSSELAVGSLILAGGSLILAGDSLILAGCILFLLIFACENVKRDDNSIKKHLVDTCKYYAYDANQIVSNLGCRNCHLSPNLNERDDRGWLTFKGLAKIGSLKFIDYVFTKKHKGWYSKKGTFKVSKMDTLSECEIKNVVRFINDEQRNIPMSSH